MKPTPNEQFYRWLKKFSAFPKWLQGLIILGIMAFLTLGFFLISSGGPTTPAQDPFANSTALALDVFLKLIIVVALIYLAAIFLRRWKGGKSFGMPRQMELKETIHLTPKRALHLVNIQGRMFMIGSTDQAVNLISEITPPEMVELISEENNLPANEFQNLLASSMKKNSA
jgi:flagellar biosynthetic protein FliO